MWCNYWNFERLETDTENIFYNTVAASESISYMIWPSAQQIFEQRPFSVEQRYMTILWSQQISTSSLHIILMPCGIILLESLLPVFQSYATAPYLTL